jgi:hypothetical protein
VLRRQRASPCGAPRRHRVARRWNVEFRWRRGRGLTLTERSGGESARPLQWRSAFITPVVVGAAVV